MAALGGAKSNSFNIGASELRIGLMGEQGYLDQTHSVGLIQSASITTTKTFAELRQGELNRKFYQKQTGVDVEISASLYEFTSKNLQLLVSNSKSNFTYQPECPAIEIEIEAKESLAIRTAALPTSWVLDTSKIFMVGIYLKAAPKSLFYSTAAKDANGKLMISLTEDISRAEFEGVSGALDVGSKLIIYPVRLLSLGDASDQFFTIDLVNRAQNTGKLRVFRFWKVGIQSGLEFTASPDSYGTVPLRASVFEMNEDEISEVSDAITQQKIRNNPMGMLVTP